MGARRGLELTYVAHCLMMSKAWLPNDAGGSWHNTGHNAGRAAEGNAYASGVLSERNDLTAERCATHWLCAPVCGRDDTAPATVGAVAARPPARPRPHQRRRGRNN